MLLLNTRTPSKFHCIPCCLPQLLRVEEALEGLFISQTLAATNEPNTDCQPVLHAKVLELMILSQPGSVAIKGIRTLLRIQSSNATGSHLEAGKNLMRHFLRGPKDNLGSQLTRFSAFRELWSLMLLSLVLPTTFSLCSLLLASCRQSSQAVPKRLHVALHLLPRREWFKHITHSQE